MYDNLSRIIQGNLPGSSQSYTYDNYGNITTITTAGSLLNTPTSSTTNRLSSGGYDEEGNLTSWNGNTYQYDAFDQLVRYQSGSEDRIYIYGPDDERFWSFRVGGNGSLWALRDLSGMVLRFYNAHQGWNNYDDYVYRDGLLLTNYLSNGQQRHFDVDHLGSIRLVTDGAGNQIGFHRYYPFGKEQTALQEGERMKFTGHERDLANVAGDGDDLDYMHARHGNPLTGRFLSPDQVGGFTYAPQSWNRYAYAFNNPLAYVDRDGRTAIPFSLAAGGSLGAGGTGGILAGGGTAVGAASGLAVGGVVVVGAGVGVGAGLLIGNIEVGGATINSHISDGLASLFLIFSKQTGRQTPSYLEGLTIEQLKELLKEAIKEGDKQARRDIEKALKDKGERNKQKGRGGKRQPKTPKAPRTPGENKMETGSNGGAGFADILSPSDLELLSLVDSIFNLDSERAAACGVGIASCPF